MPEEASQIAPNSATATLVFVSHDTRDAEIAEAFSKLLSSVSAGVLKSFRSSDKKGNQGIEYGVDWYPTIMEKLCSASDVVCLLTPYSTGRPWILYEAGVAKGQLKTPVHGLVLGLPLSDAAAGPFAQFQNCDDSIDAVTKLVMQLVGRIPNAEPDRDVVTQQVKCFLESANKSLESQGNRDDTPEAVDTTSVAQLFEEIKVMYQDLPARVESRIDRSPKRHRRQRHFFPDFVHEMMAEDMRSRNGQGSSLVGLLAALSQYKDELPWLYDLVQEACIADATGKTKEALRILDTLECAIGSRPVRRIAEDSESKEIFMIMSEMGEVIHFARMKISEQRSSVGRAIESEVRESGKSNRILESDNDDSHSL